jgi:hypothetical protein
MAFARMILTIVLVLSCLIWSVVQSYLYYRGHYPTHLLPLKALILCGSLWLGVDAASRDNFKYVWILYVGFLLPIVASMSIVGVVLHESGGIELLATLQVVGYLALCIAFCLMDTVVSACVCGACLALVGVYSYKLVVTADLGDSYLIHI